MVIPDDMCMKPPNRTRTTPKFRSRSISSVSSVARRHFASVPSWPSKCCPAKVYRESRQFHPRRKCGEKVLSKRHLAPADLPKDAASLDLPIALGLLIADEQVEADSELRPAFVGELALDGTLRPVRGVLSMALVARDAGIREFVVPFQNANEAAVVEGLDVIPVGTLAEAVGFLTGELPVNPCVFSWSNARLDYGAYDIDYVDVKGQEMAKRAALVAAAGCHHLLMIGSPGTGKTLLSQRICTILPELAAEESLETTRIYSAVAQLEPGQPLMLRRPFRSPHHTISEAGLVGGGSTPQPGELSLSHNGILFLDELPEFNRRTLEVMRQPLEDQTVTISRAMGSVTFPANVMLVAAMNPCPCGFRGDPRRSCHCTPQQIERYLGKLVARCWIASTFTLKFLRFLFGSSQTERKERPARRSENESSWLAIASCSGSPMTTSA